MYVRYIDRQLARARRAEAARVHALLRPGSRCRIAVIVSWSGFMVVGVDGTQTSAWLIRSAVEKTRRWMEFWLFRFFDANRNSLCSLFIPHAQPIRVALSAPLDIQSTRPPPFFVQEHFDLSISLCRRTCQLQVSTSVERDDYYSSV